MPPAALDHGPRAEHIGAVKIPRAAPDADLGGNMKHRVHAGARRLHRGCVIERSPDKPHPFRLQIWRRITGEDSHPPSLRQQAFHQVAAEKPSAAGDQSLHGD